MGLKKHGMKPRIYILCNGELAEPLYFQDFKDDLKARNILVKYKKEFLRKAPWDFIVAAIKFKEEEHAKSRFFQEDGDQVWCVFDVDNYWDENEIEFRKALKLANDNGLRIAWSNECFEFWFLCHFALHNSAIPRGDYHKKLVKYFKDNGFSKYRKNMRGIFKYLSPSQRTAIKHAEKLYTDEGVHENPSTSVFVLVKELLDYFG